MDSTHGKLVKGIVQAALVMIGCAILIGCAYHLKTAPGVGIDYLELEPLARDEYKIMGRTTGSVSYTHVLFLTFPMECKKGLRVADPLVSAQPAGGIPLMPFISFPLGLMTAGSRQVDAATYKALLLAPDADAILPLRTNYTRKGLWPIFWTTEATVQGKAIRIKTDDELGR